MLKRLMAFFVRESQITRAVGGEIVSVAMNRAQMATVGLIVVGVVAAMGYLVHIGSKLNEADHIKGQIKGVKTHDKVQDEVDRLSDGDLDRRLGRRVR